jgi:hypothetical protein
MRTLDRISRLYRLLVESYRRPVSLKDLQERLDNAASATIKRDIRFLRESLAMPVLYDRCANGYYLAKDASNNQIGFSIPGLWISQHEAYALLTLYNVVKDVAPAVVQPLVAPLRTMIKRALHASEHPMYGLDNKIRVQLNQDGGEEGSVLGQISYALAADAPVQLEFAEGSEYRSGIFRLDYLTMTAEGWFLDAMPEDDRADGGGTPSMEIALPSPGITIPLKEIVSATPLWQRLDDELTSLPVPSQPA